MIAYGLFLVASVTVRELPDRWIVENGKVQLSVNRASGVYDVTWGRNAGVSKAHSEYRNPTGEFVRTSDYSKHEFNSRKVKDRIGEGVEVTIVHSRGTGPKLRQHFWLYGGNAEVLVSLDLLDPSGSGTNQLLPVVSDHEVRLARRGPLQSLFVPYDNDNYFRYHSDFWSEGEGNEQGSYEVGSLYDDVSRSGVVVGSIDHTQWKSAVRFDRKGGLRAVAGVTSKYTHDQEAHGTVPGKTVKSPRFVLGYYEDWRAGLERYGDLNALVQPKLKWSGAVPFGWNSWSGHKSKVTAKDADAATDFIHDEVSWFRSGGTAYINFDSFWDNLTRDQRIAFVKKCHSLGLKAGIYWTPFVNWGEPDWKVLEKYHYRDLQLKNAKGELLPKLDGGWPLDPTHPGTLERIDENMRDFVDQGFDYIKLDFMTHGALEGMHFDPKVTTGTEAYIVGMKRLVACVTQKKIKRPFFISLSIAPMFPHGYAHSRRISCDVFSNIGASEYFLNSQNYGWWTGDRLYRFNDPDSACVYQAKDEQPTTEAEARTRFTASVIGGGMMIEGDDLTNETAKDRVRRIFSNRAALDLAAKAPAFRPVRGNTGEHAGDLFVYQDSSDVVYLAAFNFDKEKAKKDSVSLRRLGLSGRWKSEELWTNASGTVEGNVGFSLAPTDCALLRLTRTK